MLRRLSFAAALAAAAVLSQAAPKISGGPMIAYTEISEAAIWVQTTENAKVQVRYKPSGTALWMTSGAIQATNEKDNIALFELNKLTFGGTYDYQVLINGRPQGVVSQFNTQPHWRWRTEPPAIKFIIGSCAYSTDTPYDRPGQPYGGDYEIFDSIYKEKPDFMVWMGDNWYYREPDWLTEAGLRYRARFDRSQSYYQPLWRSFPHYATWDDHDFGPNNSDKTYRLRDQARKVFSDYFPAVQRGTAETEGIFFRYEWGDIEFFMLDDRSHRTPERFDGTPFAQMLGPGQMKWLKESLMSSNAPFKVVVNGMQMLNPMTFFEGFPKFQAEQKELISFIAENDVRGVVFMSGDRHATELIKTQPFGMPYPLYDYTSSPLSSGAGHNEREANNPDRVPGTWVTRKRNYGVIKVDGPRDNRVMTMEAKDKDGKLLWSHSVSARELRAPARS